MHKSAEQQARENYRQPPDHEQPAVLIAGIGASRCVRVAMPTGVS
jgi:hypothetical protein